MTEHRAGRPDASEGTPGDGFELFELRILRSLRRIVREVDVHSRKLNREYHATVPQMVCLYALLQTGPCMLSRLAREVHLSVSTVNGIVDRLETKGLVTRERSKEDRRKVVLSITPTGRHLTDRAPPLLQDRLANAFRKLPDLEQAAIALSLERVVELMDAEHSDASPNLLPPA